ncbi:MAG: GNAT family N-acetyltransferase [Flavobacteriales bacterium]|nr:GNAT family N-acetyltransferase [Flavobacteriales bacterium]
MISLTKFTEEDFDRLMVWVTNKDDLIQFAGPLFKHPLTKAQLHNYINTKEKDVYKVVFDCNMEVVGHCEINWANNLPRISRILIGDPSFRNMGLGFKIVDLTLHQIFNESDSDTADLIVFDWNKTAIRVYKKIGFVEADEKTDAALNLNGWTAIKMIINRQDWLSHSLIPK